MDAAKSRRRLIVAAAALAGTAGLAAALVLGADEPGAPPSTTTTGGLPLHESGRGDSVTPAFTTGPDWALRYTYTCPAGGTLRVLEDDPGRDGLPLLDATGHATVTVYVHDERGPHVLRTTTDCPDRHGRSGRAGRRIRPRRGHAGGSLSGYRVLVRRMAGCPPGRGVAATGTCRPPSRRCTCPAATPVRARRRAQARTVTPVGGHSPVPGHVPA